MSSFEPAAAVVLLALLVTAPPAAATNTGPGLVPAGGFKIDLDLRIQAQLVALGSLAAVEGTFGGLELHAAASGQGFGFAAGLGYEQYSRADEPAERLLQGGYMLLAVQLRPLAPLDRDVYRWFDLHITMGGRLGGVSDHDGAAFRAAFVIGGGFDVRLAPTEVHPVLGVHYRLEPGRHPDRGARHAVLFGLGIRVADDP